MRSRPSPDRPIGRRRLLRGLAPLLIVGALFCAGCQSPERRCEKSGGEWLEAACRPGLSSRACPAGTSPQVGDLECAPMGTGACAPGFETAADGWGCQPLFATGCVPGQRPVLGESHCQPIDDCQRPFPPAAATIFVDDDFAPGELDATHFASLQAAVAAAPAGAHLAIERGVYEGIIVLERPMTLEGRCVAGTLIGDLMAGWSVVIEAGVAASLSHVSFGIYAGGIWTKAGASLEASQLYLGQVGSLGLLAEGPGAAIRGRELVLADMIALSGGGDGIPAVARNGGAVSLSESWIDGYYQTAGLAIGAGSRVAFDRVIAGRGTPGAANSAFALLAEEGGRLDATDSAFSHRGFNGFHVSGEGSLLIARDVTVLDTATEASGRARGRALDVQEGAEAQVSGFTFRGSADAVVLISGEKAFLDHGVVRGVTLADGISSLNTGVAVIDGAELNLTRVALLDTANDALVAAGTGPDDGAGTHLVARELLIDGCHRNDQNAQGVGLAVVDGATVHLERGTIRAAGWVGVQVSGDGASLVADGLAVLDTRAAEADRPGIGIVVEDRGHLLLSGSRLRGTDGLGVVVGSELAGATGGERTGIEDTVIEGNTVGVNTQNAVLLQEVESLPDPLPADSLLLTEDVLFLENTLRIASERVVLPAPPPPFSP